ncbi:DUF397 domain-containing protein [Streptomyces kaniharaensis]|uniref:DUF397 domain-containing protein n=1 Tax=Streptomyces kaniharaensis TaxID=212423 RepID=A0A6N7L3X1_9ACTN|nr:DUF397 domain-containing protein [Streptomyces kaniharaensis]MQS17519.1 DUF397 domain-containing protein [Streptomyces kaniharaensis]
MPHRPPRLAPDEWTTSSHSGQQGSCVRWRRDRTAADCIEIGDSKDPDGPTLTVTEPVWRTFVAFARTFEV